MKLFVIFALYLIVGTLTGKTLFKKDMKVAGVLYTAVFGLLFLYIPIFFCSDLVCKIASNFLFYGEEQTFLSLMNAPFIITMPYFSTIAIFAVAFSVFLLITVVMITVELVVKICGGGSEKCKRERKDKEVLPLFTLISFSIEPYWLKFCKLIS